MKPIKANNTITSNVYIIYSAVSIKLYYLFSNNNIYFK